MRAWWFVLILLFGIELVSSGEVSGDEGFFDVILDFFERIFSTFTGKAIVGVDPIPPTGEWWNSSWRYRVGVEVDTAGLERIDLPIEIEIDFGDLLDGLGDLDDFDENSVRVVEYTTDGEVLWEMASDFEITGSEVGNVIWILNGTTNGVRDFLIYFESDGNSKDVAGYTGGIYYGASGDEVGIGNDRLDLRVDVSRGEGSSGIFYAERLDSGKVIFDVGDAELSAEYLKFYNGSDYFGVDFGGGPSLEFDGEIKKVVYFSGNEVLWDSLISTGNEIWRRYTIYDGLPWILMESGFVNNVGMDVSRQSDGVGVPTFDVERVFGIDNLIGPGGATADPYSWKSVTKNSGEFGVGIINLDESGTSNYFAQGSVFSGVVGIQLGATNVGAGEEISNKIAVYFNDEVSHDAVSDLRDGFVTSVVLDVGAVEDYIVDLNLSTEFDVYNLNESVEVFVEVLEDSHVLVDSVNVSFDMGTVSEADDFVLELGGDADVGFNGSYVLSGASVVGDWVVKVEAYDEFGQKVGESSGGFEVSDVLMGELNILNPTGLVNREVFAEFILRGFRNDTMVSGEVVCSYNGTSVGNVFEVGSGNYSISFFAPGVLGEYMLECVGSQASNIGRGLDWFFVEPDKTYIGYNFTPESFVADEVNQSSGEEMFLSFNLTNVGGGYSPGVNVSVLLPGSDFAVNSSIFECGTLNVGGVCGGAFLFGALPDALPGNYSVGFNVSWVNPDLSLNYTWFDFDFEVLSNPIFDLSGFSFVDEVGEGERESVVNFSLDSVGNDEVLDVEFVCVSGVVCDDFIVEVIPDSFSGVIDGASEGVEIFIEIPEGYSRGVYQGFIGIGTSNAGIKSFGFNVSVPERRTWEISRTGCDRAVLVEAEGVACDFEVDNTGNVDLNFSISPVDYNYTYVSSEEFVLGAQDNYTFYLMYNTTGAPPNQDFDIGYLVSVLGGEPASIFVNGSLLVVFGPEIWIEVPSEVRQGDSFVVLANVSDRSLSGIDEVWAEVYFPNGSLGRVDFVNVSELGFGGYTSWSGEFLDTLGRGVYDMDVIALDYSGGMGVANGSVVSYARLNLSLDTGWEDYLLGESGTIYYRALDYSGDGVISEVDIFVRDEEGGVRYSEDFVTGDDGSLEVLPVFAIPSDSRVGEYNLSAVASYDDLISGKVVGEVASKTFDVYDEIFVSLDTSVTWYPDSVMAFYLLVYSTSFLSSEPTAVDLVVYDPAQNEYVSVDFADFSLVSSDSSSALYLYKYAMPANSATGDFLASAKVYQGERSFSDVQSFRVSSGGPFDLILILDEVEVALGDNVDFDILMKNMGEINQDVYLDYWVSDMDGNNYSRVTGEAIYVPAAGNTTISRSLPIYDSQPLGEHMVYVTMDYSTVIGPITTGKNFFVVEGNETEEPEDPDTPSSSGGGGGGGGSVTGEVISEEMEFVILDVDPDELEIERGGMQYLMVEVKNNLDFDLFGLSGELLVDGEVWGVSGVVDALPMGEKMVLPVAVRINESLESGFYEGEIRVWSGSVEGLLEYEVNVFDSKDELLAHRKSRLEDRLENLRVKTVAADMAGKDVGEIFDGIQRVKLDFDLLEDRLENRKYLESFQYLDEIEDSIEELEYELDVILGGEKSYLWLVLILGIGILVLVVVILVWKWRRVLGKWRFEKLKGKYSRKKRKWKRVEGVVKSAVLGNKEDYLKTLEEQYRGGYISKGAYGEARKRYR